jgi:hypothetical protein
MAESRELGTCGIGRLNRSASARSEHVEPIGLVGATRARVQLHPTWTCVGLGRAGWLTQVIRGLAGPGDGLVLPSPYIYI